MGRVRPEAEAYRALGYSFIPVLYRDKRPALPSWAVYQRRAPSPEEIEAWWPGDSDDRYGIAIVTGSVSGGLVVLDLDDEEAYGRLYMEAPELTDTAMVATARGRHLYYRTDRLQTAAYRFPGGAGLHHLKGEGGYVLAPPSVHPDGHVYAWLTGPEPRRVPRELIEEGLARAGLVPAARPAPALPGHIERGSMAELFTGRHPEGERANALASAVGFLRNLIQSEEITRALMLAWNREHCSPPLSEHEVTATVRSIYARYPGGKGDY